MGFGAVLHSPGGATGETPKMYIKEQILHSTSQLEPSTLPSTSTEAETQLDSAVAAAATGSTLFF